MSKNTETCINRYTNSSAKYRLICFPHAGGQASFFQQWPQELNKFEVCSIRYPGRAERIDENQPTDLCLLASQITSAIQPLNDLPLILFGHSMGAAVALEVARSLENSGYSISHLIASGSRNGPLPQKEPHVEEDDESLCKHLVEMGGMASDVINDPIFLDLVLPSIRADGKMFKEYNMSINKKIKCPITTFYGDIDEHADIRPWESITNNVFNEICVKGDHFYLIDMPPYKYIREIVKSSNLSKMIAA